MLGTKLWTQVQNFILGKHLTGVQNFILASKTKREKPALGFLKHPLPDRNGRSVEPTHFSEQQVETILW
jgi:hypothetical protein